MNVYFIPPQVRAILFDIDNTLYSNSGYAEHQYDVLYSALAAERGEDEHSLRSRVEAWRQAQAEAAGGRKPSLGTAFVHFGADIQKSVEWRSLHIRPENYLDTDLELIGCFNRLLSGGGGGFRKIIAVTNNPSLTGWNTLRSLGVAGFFDAVIGLDAAGASKPDSPHFELALERARVPAEHCLSVGDRYAIDIEPALKLGMGGILVDGVEDVYQLPDLIS